MRIISIALFFVSLGFQSLARINAPDLSDVLRRSGSVLDYGFITFGFFAFVLATLSAAKGLEIFSRGKTKKEIIIDSEKEILREANSQALKLNSDLNEENKALKEKLYERSAREELLLKSAEYYKSECEKMTTEKEKLNSEINCIKAELNQQNIFNQIREMESFIQIVEEKKPEGAVVSALKEETKEEAAAQETLPVRTIKRKDIKPLKMAVMAKPAKVKKIKKVKNKTKKGKKKKK
ncbi:MAG: hypothetical protein FD145_1058 [Candidatus Saganbacteria bacterium]|uniref:Uncharacterized protein n=1 Tax=Candidatus Saganbacteria bacterium TaxID=2575572 RepID=A0A833NWU2_UNCSA|nr:MAG: hypothetical protein FD145_1058 [Candidatus Saganbacteria bacterium]